MNKQLEIPGLFSMVIPSNSSLSYEDDQTIGVITIDAESGLDLLFGVHAFPKGETCDEESLRLQGQRFMEDCTDAFNFSLERPADIDPDKFVAWQAYGARDDDRGWLARLVSKPERKHFLLLHSTGTKQQIQNQIFPLIIGMTYELDL
jgi:hypothetical protein